MSRSIPLIIGLLLFLIISGTAAAEDSTNQGFIYGTVTFQNGESQTGFLRWDSEEAFWNDLFHTGYRDNPWLEFIDQDKLLAQRRKEYYESHGLLDRIIYSFEENDDDPIGWRMLLIRYGDIVRIEINDGEDDFMITADGSRHQIGGYGNDDGADLLLYDGQAEPTEIEWNDLVSMEFFPAPAGAVPYGERLYGLVESSEGNFEGYIQWDVSECLSIDTLDGRIDGENHDYPMGEIRSIARAYKQDASVIVLKDGSSVTMGGSNDVESGNRGIMVENPEWGRVIIPWKRFQKLTFIDGKGSGSSRESFTNSAPITGDVVLKDGQTLSGRLVFDLDEGWHWDIFNGSSKDLDFNIPFPLISDITVKDEESCRVTLRSGRVLDLGDNQDTGKKNGGILVFSGTESKPKHVLWPEIQSVQLTP